MDQVTTQIKREHLRDIVAGRKIVEYRDIKPYWTDRLGERKCPFLLRLINGMTNHNPEVTVRIDRVTRSKATDQYELHIGKVVSFKNWDKSREEPRID